MTVIDITKRIEEKRAVDAFMAVIERHKVPGMDESQLSQIAHALNDYTHVIRGNLLVSKNDELPTIYMSASEAVTARALDRAFRKVPLKVMDRNPLKKTKRTPRPA